MVMKENQRKAMFAKMNNQPLPAATKPNIIQRLRILRGRAEEALRRRDERKGMQRIEREKLLLQQEIQQADRLRKEAIVESQRESIARERRKAQAQLDYRNNKNK